MHIVSYDGEESWYEAGVGVWFLRGGYGCGGSPIADGWLLDPKFGTNDIGAMRKSLIMWSSEVEGVNLLKDAWDLRGLSGT